MSTANGGGVRPTKTVLTDALQELRDREAKLRPFIDELADVKKAMKVIERALDVGASPAPSRRSQSGGGGEVRESIRNALASTDEPLSKDELIEETGSGRGLHLVLAAMVRDGTIVETEGGCYALAAPDLADVS